MKEQVMWQAPLASLPPVSPADQELPDAVDVGIVGGGITGLTAAVALAKKGAEVAVFERHDVGWGASSRNGGMSSAGAGKRSLPWLVEHHGRELGHRIWQATIESVDIVERFIAEEEIDCDYSRCGMLGAAFKPEHFGYLAAKQKAQYNEVGHETVLIPPKDLSEELGAQGYHGGLLDPVGGGLDPARYTRGLGEAAVRRGAHVFANTEVLGIAPVGSGHQLITSRGAVDAAAVLVATNGYTGKVTPQFRRRVVPVASHIIATVPLDPEAAAELIPGKRMVWDTKAMLFYFRLTPDNRLMFGGRAAWTPISAERGARILHGHMVKLYPQLAGVEVEYFWDGLVCMTIDLQPHMGRMDGIYYAMGYCGHGVAMATYFGERIAAHMRGEDIENPYLGLDFPSNPLYTGNPWFLPLIGGYYRAKDKLK